MGFMPQRSRLSICLKHERHFSVHSGIRLILTLKGKFTLQVSGTATEFERSLIRERTLPGLKTVAKAGRRGCNPSIKERDPDAIRKIRLAKAKTFFEGPQVSPEECMPLGRRMLQHAPWDDALSVKNAKLTPDRHYTVRKPLHAVHFFVTDKLLPDAVLGGRLPRLRIASRPMSAPFTCQIQI